MSALHFNSRDITHTRPPTLISEEEQLALQQTQTDTHTTVLLTDSQSFLAVQITAAHNHSHPWPFGKALRGRDGRDGLPRPPGPPGIPGAAGTPGVTAIDLCYVQPPATDMPTTVTPPPPPVTTGSGGVTYIRWGRTSCPTVDGTEDIYNGITAGSHNSHTGGGSNHICIVKDPRYHPGAGTNGGICNRCICQSHLCYSLSHCWQRS